MACCYFFRNFSTCIYKDTSVQTARISSIPPPSFLRWPKSPALKRLKLRYCIYQIVTNLLRNIFWVDINVLRNGCKNTLYWFYPLTIYKNCHNRSLKSITNWFSGDKITKGSEAVFLYKLEVEFEFGLDVKLIWKQFLKQYISLTVNDTRTKRLFYRKFLSIRFY